MRAVPRQKIVDPIYGGDGDVNRVDERLRWYRTYPKESGRQVMNLDTQVQYRSEERRVGKECRL